MTNDDIAKALEEKFFIDRNAVSSVIEDYINRRIDHDQLNEKLTNIILHHHRPEPTRSQQAFR
jgi:hypothetical protein